MTDVTIIVATHDRPVWLAQELASIRAAPVKASVRILVVDDASVTPGVEAVAKQFGCDYIRRETNGGVAAALATGFEASDSTYTSFWGDDDIMLPNWFELNLAKAAEGYDVVANSYNLVGPDLAFRQHYVVEPTSVADLMADKVAVNDGALLRREAVPGLRPERERAMMLTLWLAMAHAGAKFTTIPEATWLYRRHEANLSGPLPLQREPRFAELRREAIAEYA